MLKNPSYFLIVIIFFLISMNSLLTISKSNLENEVSLKILDFTLQSVFFILIISYFLFLLMVCISSIVVSDKLSGRCELLLANQVNISSLVKNYRTIIFTLCILPIMFFIVILFTIGYFIELSSFTIMMQNIETIIFIFTLILFIFTSIEMLIYLCLIIKKVEVIRTILSLSAMFFIFGFSALGKILIEQGLIWDTQSLTLMVSIILFLLSGISLFVIFCIKRNHTNESVILSFRQ